MKQFSKTRLIDNDRGMVSVVVTVIIMLLVTLIVLGFARLVRREQRQSLDRQLSAQAFYAAETGVNDAIEYLNNSPSIAPKTDCDPSALGANPDLGDGTEYTCVLIDVTPGNLEYSEISDESSTLIPVKSADGSDIDSITFTWTEKDGGGDFTGCSALNSFSFPESWPANCEAGVLRVDLVPRLDSNVTRDDILKNTFTGFFYPQNGGGSNVINYTAGTQSNAGVIVGGNCDNAAHDNRCQVKVKTNALGLPGDAFYARVSSLYKVSSLTINAEDNLGNSISLSGSQAVIDSTGKAQDVLRRVQVRVSLQSSDTLAVWPDYALDLSHGFCKRFGVSASTISPDAGNACNPTTEQF